MKKRKQTFGCELINLPPEIFYFHILKYIGDINTIVLAIPLTCKQMYKIIDGLVNNKLFLLKKNESCIIKNHLQTINQNKKNNKYFNNFEKVLGPFDEYGSMIKSVHVQYVLNEVRKNIQNTEILLKQKLFEKHSFKYVIIAISSIIKKDSVLLKIILKLNENIYSCYRCHKRFRGNNDYENIFPEQEVYFYDSFRHILVHPEVFSSYFRN